MGVVDGRAVPARETGFDVVGKSRIARHHRACQVDHVADFDPVDQQRRGEAAIEAGVFKIGLAAKDRKLLAGEHVDQLALAQDGEGVDGDGVDIGAPRQPDRLRPRCRDRLQTSSSQPPGPHPGAVLKHLPLPDT